MGLTFETISPPENPPDEILTLEELAARLKLSTWTIRRLIKRRVISPMRTGRVLRFHWPTVKVCLGVGVPAPAPGMRRR